MKNTERSALSVAIYTRVSTTEQEIEGLSLDNQLERCKAKAQQMYPDKQLYFTLYSDPGFTGYMWYRREGSRKRHYRPGLMDMLDAISQDKHQIVVIYRDDRLARNLKLWVDILDNHFEPNGIDFICVNGVERPLTTEGRLTSNILASISEHQRRLISENVSDVLRHKRANGYYIGDVPYGWDWNKRSGDGSSVARNIIPVPEQGKWVVKMAEMFLDGHSYESINRMLRENGVKSPSGKDTWHAAVIRGVIRNPVHAGLVVSLDGGLVEGKHSPHRFYDPEFYNRIVAEFERRKRIAPLTQAERMDLVLGKVRCAHCGERLYVDKKHNSRCKTYHCRNRSEKFGRTCEGARARIDRVDAVVERVIRELSRTDYLTAEAEKVIDQSQSAESGQLRQEKAHLERLQREDRERLNEATSKMLEGVLTEETFGHYQESIISRNSERQNKVDAIDKKLGELDNQSHQIEQMKQILHQFDGVWEELTIQEKRKVVDLLLEDVSLERNRHGAKLHIKPLFAEAITVTVPAAKRRTGDGTKDPWNLSERELAILALLDEGLTPKEVAQRSGIGRQQVYNTITSIRQRFNGQEIMLVIEAAKPVIEERAEFLPLDQKTADGKKGDERPTQAQTQILELLAKGLSKSEAARELGLTTEAAFSRLRVLRNKLGLRDYDELIHHACEKGWIEDPPEERPKPERPLFDNKDLEAYRARLEYRTVEATAKALGVKSGTLSWRFSRMFERVGVDNWREFETKMQELVLSTSLQVQANSHEK